jgi:hypothetical protein
MKSVSSNPIIKLFGLFILWKSFLLLVTILSPGLGYDTSTTLLGSAEQLATKLVRWDAIYYTKVAQRDYLFEQEWAFGWGYTRAIKLLAKCKNIFHEFSLIPWLKLQQYYQQVLSFQLLKLG